MKYYDTQQEHTLFVSYYIRVFVTQIKAFTDYLGIQKCKGFEEWSVVQKPPLPSVFQPESIIGKAICYFDQDFLLSMKKYLTRILKNVDPILYLKIEREV